MVDEKFPGREADQSCEAHTSRRVSFSDEDGVKVTAFLRRSRAGYSRPSLQGRLSRRGRSPSPAIPGSPRMIKFATGVDVLIHERSTRVAMRRFGEPGPPRSRSRHHTTAGAKAGEVFRTGQARLAVYSHGAPIPEALISQTRKELLGALQGAEGSPHDSRSGEQVTVRRFGRGGGR